MKEPTLATLVIIRRGNQVLLGVKKKAEIGTGMLNAPGGKLESKDEPVLECAKREVKEELGITIQKSDLRLLGRLECFAGGKLFQTVLVLYTESFEDEPVETDSMTPEWTPADTLPFERMHEGDRYWFDLAVQGKPFLVKIWYERPGEGYIGHTLFLKN